MQIGSQNHARAAIVRGLDLLAEVARGEPARARIQLRVNLLQQRESFEKTTSFSRTSANAPRCWRLGSWMPATLIEHREHPRRPIGSLLLQQISQAAPLHISNNREAGCSVSFTATITTSSPR